MENRNTETAPETLEEVSQEDMDRLIRHHVWASIGVGLIPIPLVDMAGLTAIQINLVRKIAKAYQIPFLRDKVKNILGALIGSGIPSAAGVPLGVSIAKTVPVVGWTVGAVTMPVLAGASTYAVGKVFVQHFSSGGTFLTFDPDNVRDYFAEMLKQGKEAAKQGGKTADPAADVKKTESADGEKFGVSEMEKAESADAEKTRLSEMEKNETADAEKPGVSEGKEIETGDVKKNGADGKNPDREKKEAEENH